MKKTLSACAVMAALVLAGCSGKGTSEPTPSGSQAPSAAAASAAAPNTAAPSKSNLTAQQVLEGITAKGKAVQVSAVDQKESEQMLSGVTSASSKFIDSIEPAACAQAMKTSSAEEKTQEVLKTSEVANGIIPDDPSTVITVMKADAAAVKGQTDAQESLLSACGTYAVDVQGSKINVTNTKADASAVGFDTLINTVSGGTINGIETSTQVYTGSKGEFLVAVTSLGGSGQAGLTEAEVLDIFKQIGEKIK